MKDCWEVLRSCKTTNALVSFILTTLRFYANPGTKIDFFDYQEKRNNLEFGMWKTNKKNNDDELLLKRIRNALPPTPTSTPK